MTHNLKGSRILSSRKVWGKTKDGTYGYLFKKITKYVCSMAERVTEVKSVSYSEEVQTDNGRNA